MLDEYQQPAIDAAIKEELDEYVAKRSKELTA
jgi:trimethylamine:corrinoid methyltransferase-like protein